MASNDHSTPVLVSSTSDPIRVGIIASADDSDRDHLHAKGLSLASHFKQR